MLARIVGVLWMAGGLWLFLRPRTVKKRLARRGLKSVRRIFFAIALVLGGLLIALGWSLEGWLAWLVVIAGAIAIIKGFTFLKAKTGEMLIVWLSVQPVSLYRIFGAVHILIGLAIFFGLRSGGG